MSDKLDLLLSRCREMLSVGDNVEAMLSFLRRNQCNKLDSIKALMNLKDMSLTDAKRAIHLSETWADMRQRDDELESALIDELSRWAEESEREQR